MTRCTLHRGPASCLHLTLRFNVFSRLSASNAASEKTQMQDAAQSSRGMVRFSFFFKINKTEHNALVTGCNQRQISKKKTTHTRTLQRQTFLTSFEILDPQALFITEKCSQCMLHDRLSLQEGNNALAINRHV